MPTTSYPLSNVNLIINTNDENEKKRFTQIKLIIWKYQM